MSETSYCRRKMLFEAFNVAYDRYCKDHDESSIPKLDKISSGGSSYSDYFEDVLAVCEEAGWLHIAILVMRIGDIIDNDTRNIPPKMFEYERAVDALVDSMYRAIYRLIA